MLLLLLSLFSLSAVRLPSHCCCNPSLADIDIVVDVLCVAFTHVVLLPTSVAATYLPLHLLLPLVAAYSNCCDGYSNHHGRLPSADVSASPIVVVVEGRS